LSATLSSRLRHFRKAQGLSLKALSQRSGVSQAMLSEIERGAKNPTVKLAYQVAQALGISISSLLEGPLPPTSAKPAGPTSVLIDPQSGVRREGFRNPLLHGRLEVVRYQLPPAARSGQMAANQPGTLETVVVLEGDLHLYLGEQLLCLVAGQSTSHGVIPTEYRNPSPDHACSFLLLVDTTRC
jgi:transcriptional regulator with XRE-family HTH domain